MTDLNLPQGTEIHHPPAQQTGAAQRQLPQHEGGRAETVPAAKPQSNNAFAAVFAFSTRY